MARARVDRSGESRRPLSIANIAETAGVSKMTVSRVINGAPGVSDRTRKRIQQLVDELDFVPNSTARALATGGSRAVGFVSVTSEISGTVAQTLVALQRAADRAGFRVAIVGLDSVTPESVRDARRQLRQEGVEVVVVTSPLNSSRPAIEQLASDFPTIGIWTPSGPVESVAAPDNELGAALATRHLLELGHATVAHISGPAAWMATDHRERGWRSELRRAGVEALDPLRSDWGPQSGYDAAIRLFDEHPEVTAVFAANDVVALGVLRAAQVTGRHVPSDLSVVGYDNTMESAFYSPPLTTVAQDYALLGVRAFNEAMRLIGEDDLITVTPLAEPRLIIRETSAPPGPRAGG